MSDPRPVSAILVPGTVRFLTSWTDIRRALATATNVYEAHLKGQTIRVEPPGERRAG